jgi:predicted ribosome quality control (RQC) complex YloA/Tae2 family protein
MNGSDNTAIGFQALLNNFDGNRNTALGVNAGANVVIASNVICIGANIAGADTSDTCFIGNIRGVTTINNDAIPVRIDSAGQLGTESSSRRYKTDIKPIEKASESILSLKPVSFRYKVHKAGTPNFGLIAEEVAKVNPDLVIYDADGKPYTVRYDAVNAMLLNEFLKEHRRVENQESRIQKQDATIAWQQKQIDALTAGLQKVSAELEVVRSAPQTVLNDQ